MTQECYIWLFLRSMKDAMIKYGLVFLLLCACCAQSLYAQKGSDRLKQQQKQLEQQIATTKALVSASKEKTAASLQDVRLIEREISFRNQLLQNIDNQIRASELKIKQKEQNILNLEREIEKLKSQYADLLLLAYKKRNKYGELMFIFSAKSIAEAAKRKLYLEKLTEIQKKQLRLIQQNKELLGNEIQELEAEKQEKLLLADQKRAERQEIEARKQEKERIYQQFKAKEQEAIAELKLQEEKNAQLQIQIQKAIKQEIEAEQRRLAEIERKAEEKRRAEAAKKGDVPTVAPKPKEFLVTKEAELAGNNFAMNKGRLPWPVEKGTITLPYGRHPHPTLGGVYTQNNGVDISSPKNAIVRAVFEGEVTSVITIPGAGKVVIIKHGNYRTVYSNLQDVYVTKGAKVDTKSAIGTLLVKSNNNTSIAHFEIHEVVDGEVKQLNPSLWISQ